MYEQEEKPKENSSSADRVKRKSVANSVAQKRSNRKHRFEFVDNQHVTSAQPKMIAQQEIVQCIKKYNHSRKLYVNSDDAEFPPEGYRWVTNINTDNSDNSEWTTERQPSRYYVGAEDLSSERDFLHSEIRKHNRRPAMTVTTYNSVMRGKYASTDYVYNAMELIDMGANVKGEVDATNPGSMSPTRYDEVHFEFPHTGVYGRRSDESANKLSLESNELLMRNSMQALGAKKLRPGGLLRISEGGWPYRDSGGRQGMNLDDLARNWGFTVELSDELGTREVGRTVGGKKVKLSFSLRHNYRAPKGPVPEIIDQLISSSTDWQYKRAAVRTNPQLIWWVNYLGYKNEANLLREYLEMDDTVLSPGLLMSPFHKDNNDYKDPPSGMGGAMLRNGLSGNDHPVF